MRPDQPAPLHFLAFDFDGTLTDFVAADIHALDTLRRAACPDVPQAAFEDRAVDPPGFIRFPNVRDTTGRSSIS